NRSIQLDPNLLEATLGKGKALSALGQPQNAIVCFNHILDNLLKPSNQNANGAIAPLPGVALTMNSEMSTTPNLGLPLLSPVALQAQALQGRGDALLNHGYIGAALDNLQQAAETDPSNPDLWVGLGQILAQLQRQQEAIASFDRALALDPNHPGAQRAKAASLESPDKIFLNNR
ncbi:MAG: tetratricopeptide repeat protein, partial [Leptolyngbyaceae bacterium]|nr:tetratricopeptide repeat protein [Leptolyngbyaceae bacterium]